jgi:hypothetical protein
VDGSELPTHCVIEARKIDGLDTTAV